MVPGPQCADSVKTLSKGPDGHASDRMSRQRTIASIVIPARNEAPVLSQCLRSITANAKPGEVEIVVVCNGCTDRTTQVARSFGPSVKVVETDIANKSHALNQGDAEARSFPRFYVDADVLLSIESIRRVAQAMGNDRILAAAPRLEIDVSGCSWPVRAYYQIWRRLPYYQAGPIGAGVYVLSESGRKWFGQFPNLLAEDDYIRLNFQPEHRCVVKDAWFKIKPPRTLDVLIKVRSRQQRGRIQLMRRFPGLWANEQRHYVGYIRQILKTPKLWPSLVIYLMSFCVARFLGWLQYHLYKDPMVWDRDRGSPEPSPVSNVRNGVAPVVRSVSSATDHIAAKTRSPA